MYLLALLSLVPLAISDLELAPYEVLKEHDGWEVRKYPTTRWVSTEGFDVMPHDGGESSKVRLLLLVIQTIQLIIFVAGILQVIQLHRWS